MYSRTHLRSHTLLTRGLLVAGCAGAAALCAAGLGTARPTQAADAPATRAERLDQKVRTDFFSGFRGDQALLDRGMKACEEVLATNPKHAEAMVWHGTGLVFQASQLFAKGEGQKGFQVWTEGLDQLDRAVTLEPDNVGVRIPRAAALLPASRFVPEGLRKSLLVRVTDDYEKVYALQKEHLDQLGSHPRGELLLGLAEAWRSSGNDEKSRAYLALAKKSLPGTPYEKEATEWLEQGKDASVKLTHNCVGCHTK